VSGDLYGTAAPYRPGGGRGGGAGRLRPAGTVFVDEAGEPVARISATAFTLPKRIATGREAEAGAYLDFLAARGFNEGRVFTRVDWTGPPGPGVEGGWEYDEAACARALEMAAARGMRLELVAHTGVHGDVRAMADHLRRVDELCLANPNALLEVYNEPWQNGGYELLDAILATYLPMTPGWASGANPPPTSPHQGEAITYHSPRKAEWSRCFKDAWEFHEGSGPNAPFSPPFRGPVMLDEPPQVEQTIRDQGGNPAPDDWRAYGAGARLFAAGATMHSNPGLQRCEVPSDPATLECIDAFVAGFADPPAQRYSGYNRLDPPGRDPGSRRYTRVGADGATYEICVRPYSLRRL
jgi:hypothetical protein